MLEAGRHVAEGREAVLVHVEVVERGEVELDDVHHDDNEQRAERDVVQDALLVRVRVRVRVGVRVRVRFRVRVRVRVRFRVRVRVRSGLG